MKRKRRSRRDRAFNKLFETLLRINEICRKYGWCFRCELSRGKEDKNA
jgi:hypothetical protein